jgi:hypothetical protein
LRLVLFKHGPVNHRVVTLRGKVIILPVHVSAVLRLEGPF